MTALLARPIVEIREKCERYASRVPPPTLLLYFSRFFPISTIALTNKATVVFLPHGMHLLTFFLTF